MANFQPGGGGGELKFCCNTYMIYCRTNFRLDAKFEIPGQSEQKFKLASRVRLAKMGALLLLQCSLLFALNFQHFGIVAAYKMREHKPNLFLTFLSARKRYPQKKRRHLQAPRVRRKAWEVWAINGRTDQ